MLFKALLLTAIFASIHFTYASEQRIRPIAADYNCTEPGYFCKDCTAVIFCEISPDGTLEAFEDESCVEPQTCLEKNGADAKCTIEQNDDCNPSVLNYVFVCQQPGAFPNPFDCKKYHLCKDSQTEVVTVDCPDGYGFNPHSLMCSTKLTNNKCNRLVKPCTGAGQGPIAGNQRLYYACRRVDPYYVPYMFHCDRNFIFVEGRCMDPDSNSLNIQGGFCRSQGLFYHPNCRQYFDCAGVNQPPTTRSCATGYYFDPDARMCKAFACDLIR